MFASWEDLNGLLIMRQELERGRYMAVGLSPEIPWKGEEISRSSYSYSSFTCGETGWDLFSM